LPLIPCGAIPPAQSTTELSCHRQCPLNKIGLSLTSQSLPVYPSAHLQVYVPTSSGMHVPRRLHALSGHFLTWAGMKCGVAAVWRTWLQSGPAQPISTPPCTTQRNTTPHSTAPNSQAPAFQQCPGLQCSLVSRQNKSSGRGPECAGSHTGSACLRQTSSGG